MKSFLFSNSLYLSIFSVLLLFVPINLFFAFSLLKNISAKDQKPTSVSSQIFASIPNSLATVSFELQVEDARVALIKNYLKKYKSPLVPYAEKLVTEADKNDLDFRLLTAIARQESNLCRYAPEDTYNCWGWGIHKAGTLGFSSFDEAIEVVSLGIKENYIDKGLKTPDDIMKKYTPHSNGSWAYGVSSFLDDIR